MKFVPLDDALKYAATGSAYSNVTLVKLVDVEIRDVDG